MSKLIGGHDRDRSFRGRHAATRDDVASADVRVSSLAAVVGNSQARSFVVPGQSFPGAPHERLSSNADRPQKPGGRSGVGPFVAWFLALAYLVTVGLFVAAAWIAGVAGICDTCQGQDDSGIELAIVIAGVAAGLFSAALTRYSIRRGR